MGQLPDVDEYFHLRNWITRKFHKVNAIVTFSARHIAQHAQYVDPESPVDFVSRFDAAVEKYPNVMTPAQVINYAATNVSAGSDTTAIILREIVFRVVNDQQGRYKVLQNEIKNVLRARTSDDFDRHISWNEGHKMTYLQACIKETMRIHPALGQILPRIVPTSGVHLCGKFIPEGTEVGCNAWTVHRDRAVFGDDVDDWRPERWLDSDEHRVKEMDRYIFIFGGGSRTCIGRHIAMLELSKLVPELFRTYEIQLIDPSRYTDHCKWLVVQTGLDVKLWLRDQRQWLSEKLPRV
ncbi:hypothetical protein LTR28_008116 [Elasticomyces elasticus]|nr:hypothetical protein LTR28_008116 [Elasticomyces elasticus]